MNIKEIVERQREYFNSGITKSYAFRMQQLTKLEEAIKRNEKALLKALYDDLRKTPYEGYMTEVGIALEEIRYHKKHLKKWMARRMVSANLTHLPGVGYICPEPYGVVLIVSPWNYPINLCFQALIGAISAGNCAVVKPSAYAENTSHEIKRILLETFPPEYVAVVEGGRAENQELFNQRFDYIFFTGSVSVGKVVMESAAKNLTPITLELGGKSPVIVDETANIRLAAKRLAFGKSLNAGQTCIAPDYLLIHESRLEEFIAEFEKAVKKAFPNGDYSEMPVIINEKHFKRLENLLTQGTIRVGGTVSESERFIEPTLLTDVDPQSELMQDEIFGPLLPVITYSELDEVIDFVRNREKPLALYLFTRRKSVVNRILHSLSFGGGCVNDVIMHIVSPKMPFGGVGNSGMGNYHGKKSFETFTHRRSVLMNFSDMDPALRYHPYTKTKKEIIARFMGREKWQK